MSDTRTAELVARVARWRRAGHPVATAAAVKTEAAALESGASPAEVLAASGAEPSVIAVIRATSAKDLDRFLEELARVLGRAEERRRALRHAAGYPAMLAASSVLLVLVLAGGVRPAASAIAGAATGGLQPLSLLPVFASLIVSSVALVWLALALRADSPVFPFAAAKKIQERALLLGVAAIAARHETPLHTALSAAASLCTTRALREEAVAAAGALSSGAVIRSPGLLGTLGSAAFTGAAKSGEGKAMLGALAELAEATAAADVPHQLARAEVVSVLIASVAIATAAASLYGTYTAALAATAG